MGHFGFYAFSSPLPLVVLYIYIYICVLWNIFGVWKVIHLGMDVTSFFKHIHTTLHIYLQLFIEKNVLKFYLIQTIIENLFSNLERLPRGTIFFNHPEGWGISWS